MENVTLKVVYYDQNMFNRDYGELFASRYPNIDVEVLPITYYSNPQNNGVDSISQYIITNQPDVVLLRDIDLITLSQKKELVNLSFLIKEEKYDLSTMLPSVIDLIRKLGDGDIYGLAPTFENTALFYNKDIFDKAGIDYPVDNMTWKDVLLLSQRFNGNESAYGFYKGKNSSLFNFVIKRIGYLSGINFYNAKDKKITLNTAFWKSIFEQVIEGYHNKSLFLDTNQEIKSRYKFSDEVDIVYGSNLFVKGKAAMTIDSIALASDIEKAQQALKNITPMNWAVVTMPVDPLNPDETTALHLNQIFSINAKSQNIEAAWELIKFINGEEWAKLKSKSSSVLLTRFENMKEMYGHDIEAFYKLKPNGKFYNSDGLPDAFHKEFNALGNEEILKVIQGTSTLEDALIEIEKNGQVILNKYVQ
ncbi:ABC transporter substrate-binding protein [Cohnella herbarum]|uniref:Extracellular solute-binding protein n=1 Tax=Cohnella herbarum TaxID=2728023 RepID=A0A7Z2VIK5_9BACL|nr:extracellular solute-binding protein [Cohnella herbarum]QJD83921.1 extracellular solute-binding protein [Cohnella herbarum]